MNGELKSWFIEFWEVQVQIVPKTKLKNIRVSFSEPNCLDHTSVPLLLSVMHQSEWLGQRVDFVCFKQTGQKGLHQQDSTKANNMQTWHRLFIVDRKIKM